MMIKKAKVAFGILTRSVVTGPIEVSVDLTRNCNLDCLMCWWRSPLLGERPSPEWAKEELSYESFKELIQDFKRLDVGKVILGGQGEPFMYPRLFDAIELTKRAGIKVSLVTSGYFLNESNIRTILDLKVDHMDTSLQAATAQTYVKIHPSQSPETFYRIKEHLISLHKLKKASNRATPHVRMIYVICNLNYSEVVKAVELAKEVGAESMGFKRMDVTDQTKPLLLNKEEAAELGNLLNKAKEKADDLGIAAAITKYRRYILEGSSTGVYTARCYSRIPCYVGWRSARILADGDVIPCCGCYSTILGNIYRKPFREIWRSQEYRDFRARILNVASDTELREKCKCWSCVDAESNLGIYRALHPIKGRKEIL